MPLLSFTDRDFLTVSDALEIAEDVTANFFKFSTAQWRRHCYEVKALGPLEPEEPVKEVLAFLKKGSSAGDDHIIRRKLKDYYLICLQDHMILLAAQRDIKIALLPLLLYVFTHELIHIVRFCSFKQLFDARPMEREREERLVHELTYKALGDVSLPNLGYVLESYSGHRVFELGIAI